MKAKMYRIHGFVQGVGFRAFVYHHAKSLGIKGFVQNEVDGTVTVLAEGEEEALEELENYLKSGPSFSRVSEVEEFEVPLEHYEDFEVR